MNKKIEKPELESLTGKDKSFTAAVRGSARAHEAEAMTGIDPYEDEIEDGIPMWLYALLMAILMLIAWIKD